MNHYPHHIGDYIKDTMGLTQGEHGAYRLLMDASYACENGVAKDDVYAIGRAATALERKAVDRVLSKFFFMDEDGRYHQKRIDEEVALYQQKAATNRENGKTGGRPRTNPEKTQTVSESEPKSIPTHNPEITLASNQEPITKQKNKKIPLPDGFGLSPELRRWASQHGYVNLEAHLAYFIDWARSSNSKKVDWDATFRNAIRGNWAKVGGKNPQASMDWRSNPEIMGAK